MAIKNAITSIMGRKMILLFQRYSLEKMLWLYYIEGVSEYVKMNRKETWFAEVKSMWLSMVDEFIELINATRSGNSGEMFDELFDVLYCFVKLVYTIILPFWILESRWVWIPLFPLMYPATQKYARRYREYGCVRSKRNHGPKSEHKCNSSLISTGFWVPD